MSALFALAAAVGWGSSDFAAGYASRKSTATSVVILTHLASVIALFIITVRIGPGGISIEGSPTTADIMWGLAAGVAGGAGAMLLFQGLGKGSMAVVAPITATGAASIPVVFGILTGDPLTVFGGLGIILALVAIVLVSLTGGDDGALSDTTDVDMLEAAVDADIQTDTDSSIEVDAAIHTDARVDAEVDTVDETSGLVVAGTEIAETEIAAIVDADGDEQDNPSAPDVRESSTPDSVTEIAANSEADVETDVETNDEAVGEPMLVPAAWTDEFQLPQPSGSRLMPSTSQGATARFDAQFDARPHAGHSTADVEAAVGPTLPAHSGASTLSDAKGPGRSVSSGFISTRMSAARVEVSIETEADVETAPASGVETEFEDFETAPDEPETVVDELDTELDTDNDDGVEQHADTDEDVDPDADGETDVEHEDEIAVAQLDAVTSDSSTAVVPEATPNVAPITAAAALTPREIRMSLRGVQRAVFILVATAVVSAAAIAARPISALLDGDEYTGAVTAQLVFAFVIVGLAAYALNQMKDLFDFSDLLTLGKSDDEAADRAPRNALSAAGAPPPVSWQAMVRQPGVPEALFSGLGFGLFFVFIYRAAEDAGHWPLVVARAVSVVMFCFIAYSTRSALLPERGSRRPVVLAGLLDAAAAVFFVMSTRAGLLSVGAVLAALYPVVTVLLARVITKERIRRKQMAGLALALCAVALLAA